MLPSLRILYQDDHLVAIDKPAGFQVHTPEDPRWRVSNQRNCVVILRKQLGQDIFPIHRLDRATSGVLLFALQSQVARDLQAQWQEQSVRKDYLCVTRGWIGHPGSTGSIDSPLKEEGDSTGKESITQYQTLATMELPYHVGRYPTARYSLMRVAPLTGRRHQIRRHMVRISHPIIGDTQYGDGDHNQHFRQHHRMHLLFLKAARLEVKHPKTGASIVFKSRFQDPWLRCFDLFQFCPTFL